jgi:hypothetical protein
MKLLCFPHYTAGGVLCDILENKFSPVQENGGIRSFSHSYGKIGDSESIFTDFDTKKFESFLSTVKHQKVVIGTHCWPGPMDLSICDQVILITTETTRSKIYRWLRAWHLYFSKQDHIRHLTGIELIDKQRETAKNYLQAFSSIPQYCNLEFADLVETTAEFYDLLDGIDVRQHMDRWKSLNSFLYDSNMWNNSLVKRYHEAEFELAHGKYYKYV